MLIVVRDGEFAKETGLARGYEKLDEEGRRGLGGGVRESKED